MVGGNLETAHLYMKYNARFTPPEATRRDRCRVGLRSVNWV